jgi:integrase
MLRENNVRTGFFEPNEFLGLTKVLPIYLRPMVTFAYYTGWRKREILGLKWNQVDLQQQIFRLNPEQAKNGVGRIVAPDGELLAILKDQYEARNVFTLVSRRLLLSARMCFTTRANASKTFDRLGRAF